MSFGTLESKSIVLFPYHSVLLLKCLTYCIAIDNFHRTSVQGGLIEETGGRRGPLISFLYG